MMALVDLYWTDAKTKKSFTCSTCPESKKRKMKCADPGFVNLPEPVLKQIQSKGQSGYWEIDSFSLKYLFCPGKATWFPEMARLFIECRMAYQTGFLPNQGGISDQSELFAEVFPEFVERWEHRKYWRIWRDVIDFTPKVLEQLGRMMGMKIGGS